MLVRFYNTYYNQHTRTHQDPGPCCAVGFEPRAGYTGLHTHIDPTCGSTLSAATTGAGNKVVDAATAEHKLYHLREDRARACARGSADTPISAHRHQMAEYGQARTTCKKRGATHVV